jgi:hypothetical protein
MATNTALVQQLYVAYFNRPADVASLKYYVSVLDASADPVATAKVISKDFANATEYKSVYANLSADATINTIYHNLFGHEADIPGLNYWSALYAAGKITLAEIVTSVAAGAQGTDATAFANKVTAAGAFTDTIALSADQQLAYANNPAALALAQSYLAGVTDDASLAAAVADVSTTAASVVPSVTSTLTVGIDTLTGGTGNDTFNTVVLDSSTHLPVNVLNAGDTIDGGAGVNTVNITNGGAGINDTIAGTFKNIQIFNIDNTAGAAAAVTGTTVVDASKLGTAAKQIWQISKAADVTNLGASTVAGFKSIATAATLNVGAAATVTGVSVALKDVAEASTVAATGAKLTSVTLSGTVTDTDADGTIANTIVTAALAKDAQTFTLKSGVDATLTVTEDGAATKHLTTVDVSASTGDITYDATAVATVANIKGGAGDDKLTIATLTNKASTGVAAINAVVDAGAGKNTVTVKTTGDGATTVTTGAGNDTVNVTTRSDGILTVNLGDGNDTFTSAVAINGTDVIDAGAGFDTLLLNLVGSNNIGAFSNFDAFDLKGLNKTLDVDILAAKNTVTEFVASGDVGAAGGALINIGAGIGFRATADLGVAHQVSLTQKVAGALTVTVDADETGTDDTVDAFVSANVKAANATSVKAVFDTTFVGDANSATDNHANLQLSSATATTLSVVSGGGANVINNLQYTDLSASASAGKLASITVTGDTELDLHFIKGTTNSLATVDSSAATGSLHFAAVDLATGGTIKLGSGADVITLDGALTASNYSISGLEKTLAVSVSTAAGDATAAAAAIKDADVLVLTGNTVAADVTVGADTIKDGVLTFGGAGPSTLTAAIAAAHTDAAALNTSVVFQYLGDTYVFSQGAAAGTADDVVVKLAGTTGVTHFVEDGVTGHFFIV